MAEATLTPSEMTTDDLVDYAPSHCFGEEFPLVWQMTRPERFCFLHLIKEFKPALSLEIGTSKGGSLQVLSRYSGEVISIDIDPAVATTLKGSFANVTFESGDSATLLPRVIEGINGSGKELGFVLIDGDHSEQGVRRDINAILKLRPRRPIAVLLHDSFHPPCRKGMLTADWAASLYVHYVELDFVTGIFVPGRESPDLSLVSGLGFALLLPEERQGALKVLESQGEHYNIVHRFAAQSGFLDRRWSERLLRLLKAARTRLRRLCF